MQEYCCKMNHILLNIFNATIKEVILNKLKPINQLVHYF
jgi:hypothetical protein